MTDINLWYGALGRQLLLREVVDAIPDTNAADWHDMDGEHSFNNQVMIPAPIAHLFELVNSKSIVESISRITEIPNLRADPTLYGAGLNVGKPGDKLDLHQDLDLHPKTGMERRIGMTIFLNDEWFHNWNGDLQFWTGKEAPESMAARVWPRMGQVVFFEPSTFHGWPDPLNCPEGYKRITMQSFYYTVPRSSVAKRRKAHFAPRPGDAPNAELDKLRSQRESRLI